MCYNIICKFKNVYIHSCKKGVRRMSNEIADRGEVTSKAATEKFSVVCKESREFEKYLKGESK